MGVNTPSKYQFLETASALSINTPSTLFLREDELLGGQKLRTVDDFIEQNNSSKYIIRSCVANEDGNDHSWAGHFFSSAPVAAPLVHKTIQQAFDKNKALCKQYDLKAEVNLMVQPYVEAKMGGILFSPWQHFPFHALGEVALGGAEKAVAGEGIQAFVLSKEDRFKDLDVPELVPVAALKKTLRALDSSFDFPLDIEWVSDGVTVTVLQLRPITVAPQALKVATASQINQQLKRFETITSGAWSIEALAENLGSLSPLSFEVVQAGFEAAQAPLQRLGFKALTVDFLARADNGQVYVNSKAYTAFYEPKSWWTPFICTVKAPVFEREMRTFWQVYNSKSDFKLEMLLQIFAYWQVANILALKSGRAQLEPLSWPGEYEVLHPQTLNLPEFPSAKMTWDQWRQFCKQWWVWEYQKLKSVVAQNPLRAFCLRDGFDARLAQKTYETAVAAAVFDLPSQLGGSHKAEATVGVVKGDLTEAPVLVIQNPARWRGVFPDSCVLVAPYFDNKWMPYFDHFKGIVLEQGGQLSHSAIVAREKKTPYYINWAHATEKFKDGDLIS